MFITAVRTLILYTTVLIVMRLMGKRQIGQLQPFELAVTIIIAELASIPMEDTGVPIIRGLTPIIMLLVLHFSISLLGLKFQFIRKITCGTPSVLIEKGQIKEKELRKLRYSLSDLLEQLRVKNYPNLNEIDYAFLETNGELSVIPKAENRNVVVKDINVTPPPAKLPVTLIMDGVVQWKNLKKLNLDRNWLDDQLRASGIKSTRDVLIAMLDTNGKFFAQSKNTNSKGESKK